MKKISLEVLRASLFSFLVLTFSLGIGYLFAWTGPTQSPPDGNVTAPINVGNSKQVKGGDICTKTPNGTGPERCLSTQGTLKVVQVTRNDVGTLIYFLGLGYLGESPVSAVNTVGAGLNAHSRPCTNPKSNGGAPTYTDDISNTVCQDTDFADMDGLACNSANGWYITGCFLATDKVDAHRAWPYPNGCVTQGFDNGVGDLTIMCAKQN